MKERYEMVKAMRLHKAVLLNDLGQVVDLLPLPDQHPAVAECSCDENEDHVVLEQDVQIPVIVNAIQPTVPFLEVLDDKGNTPLMNAILVGNFDIVQFLLDSGAALETRNVRGETALMLSIENKRHALMELLLLRGADVNVSDDCSGKSPLMIAVEKHDCQAVALLLKFLEVVYSCDAAGCTVLHYCARTNFADCLKVILPFITLQHCKYIFNAKNGDGETAFEIAKKCQSYDALDLLEKSRKENRSEIPDKNMEAQAT